MLHYLYFIICLFEIINATSIKDENDIINTLINNTSGIVTLDINSEIDISKEIKIKSSIKKLSIIGNSLDSSKLYLKYPLYFDPNLKEIEIRRININGKLFFKNNEIITLSSVNLNGYIDSDFFNDNNNNSLIISNFNYKPTEESVENCINLSGNVKIDNSNFYGNSSCRNRLLHYNGYDKYTLDLKDSYFNGEYECPFLNIENALNAIIETSNFEKGYSSKDIDGGAGVMGTFSNINILNCTFNDILSHNDGGAFYFNNNIRVEGTNLNFNNVTSLGLGSLSQISSEDLSILNFSNITQYNTGNIKRMRDGGLIMNIEGHAKVNINSYHGENLINYDHSGSAFILSSHASLTINNLYIKNLIGNGEQDGLFYTSHNSLNVKFNAYNITLYNLYQMNIFDSSIVYIEKNNYFNMDGFQVLNSGGYNTNFINAFYNSNVYFCNFEVDNFESKTVKEFINYFSDFNYYTGESEMNTINNCKISNIISPGALFRIRNGSFNIYSCEFRNIHECYKYNNCTSISTNKQYVQDTELLIGYGGILTTVYFTLVNIDQMYGNIGVVMDTTTTTFYMCNVLNSFFKNGFLYMNEKEKQSGGYTVWYTNFENNTSEYGTIFNVPYLSHGKDKYIQVYNSSFINNTASKFGGVIYSLGEYSGMRMNFTYCYFENNHAKYGNIVYAYSKERAPEIENLNSMDISVIPSHFQMDEKGVEKISILSGESIPKDIMFKLYDDYGNQIYFPQKTSNIQFEDLILFNVEVNDTYNAKVLGQTKDYCWDDVCILPSVKVIGNPGIYTLSLKIKSYGIYPKFVKDSADIEIEIRECDTKTYLYQPIGNTYLKSCYKPKCEFGCGQKGQCINNDLCDCGDSNFKGKYCNEYIILGRNSSLDIVFIVMALVMLFVIIVSIGMTVYYRNNPIIKGGGFDFLIIILIGLIINTVNIIFLTFKKTTYICYHTYLYSNTGFSFVFGSIFVKTYRIYKIFCREQRYKQVLNKKKMLLIIALMTLFHWTMALCWYISNGIKTVNDYTSDDKEFVRCEYPKSKNLSSLFNFVILVVEFLLSYSIRKVEKRFKEALVIPAYVYILYILFMYINSQNEKNVIIQDYFDIIGTIINTLVSVYNLFIIKFIEILAIKQETSKRPTTIIM